MSDLNTSATVPVAALMAAPRVPAFRVLTVCTGNLYRSPLAECLLRERLAAAGEAIQVTSAGTEAVPGTGADGWGARAGDAAARRLTAGLVESADLVLGAATEHREAAVRLSPAWALSRAFSLREFARLVSVEDADHWADPADRLAALVAGAAARRGTGGSGAPDDDVPDPLGASAAAVRECVARIEEAVERVVGVVLGGAPR